MRKKKQINDVWWYVPERKKPIAYSTKATSELIVALSEPGKKIFEVLNEINYDEEAKEVLRKYIGFGYGDVEANIFFG